MRKELKLEKTELLVYAIIYGFCSDGGDYTGGIKYLSEWSGSGRTAVKDALHHLEKRGYIIKSVKNEYNEYTVNEKWCGSVNASLNRTPFSDEFSKSMHQKFS